MLLRNFAFAAALAVSASSSAYAGTTSGTPFTVQVTVNAGCNIDSGPTGTVDFGAVAGTATAPADVSSTILVTCTNTTVGKIYFTSTNTVTSNTDRIMTAVGPSTDQIGYQIRNGTTPIGNTAVTGYSFTSTGAQHTLNANFHLTNWNPAAPFTPDVYRDTVTMHVDF